MSADFKEKNSFHGKGFLIAIVIFFSSLSFTLGYFVGKIGREEKTAVQSLAAPAPSAMKEQELPQKPPEKAELAHAESARDQEQKTLPDDLQYDRSSRPPQASPAPSAVAVNRPSGPKPAHPESAKKSEPAAPKEPTREPLKTAKNNGVKYTVQIAALKSAPEAKKMRLKLAGKGFKPYVNIVKDKKKRAKIYKVRAGEFDDRKQAEILALKINKSEGLKSFVTAKN